MMKPSYERIKFLQNQLRTAIQNHHVLLLKSRITPQDTELKNQMNILQSLIISMGRTQNDLLGQLERELDHNAVTKADVLRHLSWRVPLNIPIFNREDIVKIEDSNVKSASPVPSKKPPRVYSRVHSLLKPKDSNIHEPFGKNDDMPAVWKNPKKLQSVLKPKSIANETRGFIKLQSDTTKICGDSTITDGSNDDPSTSPKRRKTTDSEPNSRSRSTSPKLSKATNKALDKDAARKKAAESKLWTRSKRRRAVEAAAAAARAASFKGISGMDINEMEETLKNEPLDPTAPVDENLLKHRKIYEEMGQTKFLGNFRLISLSEREALRVKKCGRKRRTAAGQSSFYNDYLQHSALTIKNPKWRHEMQPVRRAPRKVQLVEVKRVGSPTDQQTSGEVTPEEKSSPPREIAALQEALLPMKDVTVIFKSASQICAEKAVSKFNKNSLLSKSVSKIDDDVEISGRNSIVVEATDIEEDEEKDKDKLCILCRAPGEEGTLEVCTVCGEKYHLSCINVESDGRCSLCVAQISGFKNIVGGETGVSSSSSLDVIKRYLPS